MILIPAILLSAVLAGLALLHFTWAARGMRGLTKVVPTRNGEPLFEPGRLMTLVVALMLSAAAIVPLWHVGSIHLGPDWMPRLGVWTIAAVFALRAVGDFRYVGLFKRFRDSDFARNDTAIYTPLCGVISALALWLAAGS